MSARHLAKEQPESFEFNADFAALAQKRIAMYPEGKQASAIVPLLWFAQKQHDNWIPEAALRHIGDMLDMAYIRVLEVVTFYTMFNLAPVGKHFVQFCGTTPCWLNGSDKIKNACKSVIGDENIITEDGEFSWLEVECLGACVNAPMVQINDDYYEDLDEDSFKQLLADLKAGNPTKIGPQTDRENSAPLGGNTTLIDNTLYDGSMVGDYKSVLKQIEKAEAEAAKAAAVEAKIKAKEEAKAIKTEAKAETKTEEKPKATPKPKAAATPKAKAAPKAKKTAESATDRVETKPEMLTEARGGKADDLKKISGVGPKIESILHELGVYHFDQVASWDADQIAWVDSRLKFKGRIDREDWIAQAKKFVEEGDK
uniref:NADH-quinone oxidoreductase subunit NuoE n=1 Tax=OCS116 cluster bacterium TaxID=2030921 RepID=A0A2A4Z3Z0_9PROT